jgi:hypothetical protein
MVDEQEPPKRVVKRVVKKTVTRPVAPSQAAPTVRYGRPVPTTTQPRAKVATRPAGKQPAAPATKTSDRPRIRRPNVDLRARLSTVRDRTGSSWGVVAGGVARGARTTGQTVSARARTVAAWRLPHINLHLAAAITGAVVGLVTVGLGALALVVFESVRGVSSGGGLWGGLTLVGLAIVAVLLGQSLLRGFGSPSARLTSVLAVVLAIVALLGLFLDLADSWTAIVLLPLLGVAAFALSHWLVEIAEHAPPVID